MGRFKLQSCIHTILKNSDTSQVTRQSIVGALFFAFGYRDNFGIYRGLTNNILQLVCHKIIIISTQFYDGCGSFILVQFIKF